MSLLISVYLKNKEIRRVILQRIIYALILWTLIRFYRIMDLDIHLVEFLMEFVYQLLCSGDLLMGKALRIKLLEKYLAKLQYHADKSMNGSLTSQNIYTR